jgi:RNA polymerase sigma-70 factor (ECF subfamily)
MRQWTCILPAVGMRVGHAKQRASLQFMNQSGADGFTTTNWSLVLAAADDAPVRARNAMERLCSRYWFPVYAHVRQRGNEVHQAEDLTQGFFEYVIEHQVFQRARQDRGRLRSFILGSLKHYLRNHHDRQNALKRGGRFRIVPLDETIAETLYASEPPTAFGDSFDRRWAATLIRRVMENLRNEYARRGRSAVHDALLPHLTSRLPAEVRERLASSLEMDPATLRVVFRRFRHRFGELLRREVAYTVAAPEDVEEEIRYLLTVLADG